MKKLLNHQISSKSLNKANIQKVGHNCEDRLFGWSAKFPSWFLTTNIWKTIQSGIAIFWMQVKYRRRRWCTLQIFRYWKELKMSQFQIWGCTTNTKLTVCYRSSNRRRNWFILWGSRSTVLPSTIGTTNPRPAIIVCLACFQLPPQFSKWSFRTFSRYQPQKCWSSKRN